jgi:hypothetical protein
MKKILSYLFVALMFMNIMGYYGILTGLHYNATQSFERKLNADIYNTSEVVEFSFPIAIPYVMDGKTFERAEGQFEYNGEYYHLVKQQYANDTLKLVCVKNKDTKRISSALRDYVKTFADQPSDAGKSHKEFSGFLKDYLSGSFSIVHTADGWTSPLQFSTTVQCTSVSFHMEVNQPPELA